MQAWALYLPQRVCLLLQRALIVRSILAASLLFLVSCSRLDKEANCLNDKSACFKADKTAPTLASVNPAITAAGVSELTYADLTFSEEMKGGDVMDNYSLSGVGASAMTLASVAKVGTYTYRVYLNGAVNNGPIRINFAKLTDYNGNTFATQPFVEYEGNTVMVVAVSAEHNRGGVSTNAAAGGYGDISLTFSHNYRSDTTNSTSWFIRITPAVADCNAGTAWHPLTDGVGTNLPALDTANLAATQLTRVFAVSDFPNPYNAVVICMSNATNPSAKAVGVWYVRRNDTAPTVTYTPPETDAYNSPVAVAVTCAGYPARIAVTETSQQNTSPPNPATPAFDANSGAVTTGSSFPGGNASVTAQNPANPTRTKFTWQCIDVAGNKSDLTGNSNIEYYVDSTIPGVNVTLDASYRSFVSATGYTSTTLNFTTDQATGEQWLIKKGGTSCTSGGTIMYSGTVVAPGATISQTINVGANATTDFNVVGVYPVRICVNRAANNTWGTAFLQITRDDTAPTVSSSVTSGSYGAVQSVTLSCTDNADVISHTKAVQLGKNAPALPPAPPFAGGTDTVSGPITLDDSSTTIIRYQCRDKAGNLSGIQQLQYTIDSTLPNITVVSNERSAISNGGGFASSQLLWRSTRGGLPYEIRRNVADCSGLPGLSNPNNVLTGTTPTDLSNINLSLNTTNFPGEGAYNLKICVFNFVDAPTYQPTTLDIVRDDSRPNDVTGLTVTGGNATSVALSWTAATDNGAAGIGGYRIYQSTTPGDFTSATEYTSLTNSVNISGLSASTTYYFVVKALDNAGNLSLNYSNEVQSKFTLSVSLSGYGSAVDGPFRAQLGSGEILSFTANGTQSFSQVFVAGDTYSVTIVSQPAGRNCAFTVNQYGTLTAPLALQARCANGVLHSGALNGNKAATLGFHLYRGNATILAGVGGGAVCPGSNNALCRDGVGLQGQFHNPHGMTIAKEVLYIADRENNRIRAFDLNTSTTSTFAGEGAAGSTDGIGTGARLNKPQAVTTDGVNLYVAESPNAPDAAYIRRIDILTQQVTTIAGGATVAGGTACPGVAQANCRDGTGGQALFGAPNDIKYHDGSLYISEYGNNRVRRLQLATGQVITIAGDGNATSLNNATGTSASFNGATGLTIVGNTLYVVDFNGHRIRSISLTAPHAVATIAGSGTAGHADGPSSDARFSNPDHIFSDARDLYVTEYVGNRVRRINLQANVVSTIVGNGTGADTAGTGASASLNGPVGIVSDGYRFYAITFTGGQLFRITNSGLVGHWPLAGDASDYASDVTSASNGTTNGAPSTIATDRFGSSGGYAFDGVDDYLSMSGTNLPIGNAARTVCAWVRIEDGTNTGNDGIVTYGQRGPNTVFGLRMSNPSQVSSWSASSDVNFNLPLPVTNWTHTCVTHNGSVTQVFQNGRLLNSSAASYNTQTGSLCIGERSATGGGAACDTPNNHFFKGSIAEIRIYNRALNEAEINELAQDAVSAQVGASISTAATGLLSHYPFTNAVLNNAVSDLGPLQLTLTHSASPTVLTTLDKDGETAGAYSFVAGQAYFSSSSAGLPMGAAPRSICAWVQPYSYPSAGSNKNFVRYGTGTNGNFGIFMYNTGVSQRVGIITVGNDYVDPQFKLPLYSWSHFCATYNGSSASVYVNGQNLGTINGYGTDTQAGNLAIGGNGTAIDDVRIYNNALSAAQVKQLSAQVPSGLVARYALDGDGSDASGWANNASAQTGSATQDRFAMNTTALSYARASSQRTVIPHAPSLNPDGNVTLAAWVRPTTLPATGEVAFVAAKDIFGASGYGLELYNNAGVQSIVWLTPGTTGAHYAYALPVGVYSHLAVTQTGTTATLYINGAPITASTYAVAAMTPTTTADFVIGGDALNATGYFNGAIDDVRLYSRALSQNEVRALVTQPNKKIQISATMNTGVHDGGGGIAAADALCTSAGTNFKALIVDNSVRRACTSPGCGTSGIAEQIDWVLRPNITYLRADALTPIVTADFTGLLPTPLLNMVTGAGDQAWTGLNADWTVSLHTCNSWTTTSNQGQYGVGNATGGQSYSANNASCSSTLHVYCVEQ